MKVQKLKGIISSILIALTIIVYTTGIILLFLKKGMWLCFTRVFIHNVHAVSAITMAVIILIHFYLNRKIYKREVQSIYQDSMKPDEIMEHRLED